MAKTRFRPKIVLPASPPASFIAACRKRYTYPMRLYELARRGGRIEGAASASNILTLILALKACNALAHKPTRKGTKDAGSKVRREVALKERRRTVHFIARDMDRFHGVMARWTADTLSIAEINAIKTAVLVGFMAASGHPEFYISMWRPLRPYLGHLVGERTAGEPKELETAFNVVVRTRIKNFFRRYADPLKLAAAYFNVADEARTGRL